MDIIATKLTLEDLQSAGKEFAGNLNSA